MTDAVRVTGGAAGITARYDDMHAVGDVLRQTGVAVLQIAAECHRWLADADLAASAILDPAGAQRFGSGLLAALDGRRGLTSVAADIAGDAIRLAAAVATYRGTDALVAEATESRRDLQGRLLGSVTRVPLAAFGIGFVAAEHVGAHPRSALLAAASGGESWLTEHPGAVDEIVGSAPGYVAELAALPMPGELEETLLTVGTLYPDGRAEVRSIGTDLDPAAAVVPAGVADLFAALGRRASAGGSEVDVRTIVYAGADGEPRRSHIVSIPGTREWNLPGRSEAIADTGTNVRALGQGSTSYGRGVVEALRLAGVARDEPVMLVGHSQGGMVAVGTADRLARTGEFTVAAVVTAGSPIAGLPLAGSVQLLAVENEYDIVPHLDAAPNGDEGNRTTVTFAAQHNSVGANHSIDGSYLDGGRLADGDDSPSLQHWRSAMAGTFLFPAGSEASVTTQRFGVRRVPLP